METKQKSETFSGEELVIDGCRVKIYYANQSDCGQMDSIREVLLSRSAEESQYH